MYPKTTTLLLAFLNLFILIHSTSCAMDTGFLGRETSVHSKENAMREISIVITVPNTAWSVAIDEIYIVNSELWVISKLERTPLMAAQVISTIRDTVQVSVPAFPVKHFVTGRTWKWHGEGNHIFIQSTSELRDALSKGQKIFDKKDITR